MKTTITLLGFAIAFFAFALPSQAHTWKELNEFLDDWTARLEIAYESVIKDDVLWPDTLRTDKMWQIDALIYEYQDMRERHPSWDGSYQTAPVVVVHRDTTHRGMGSDVERWRALVEKHFPHSQVDKAMRVMACESGGNPNARSRANARGLFQILPKYWTKPFGITADQLYNAETNVRIASKVWQIQGWRGWSCGRRLGYR